MSDLISRQAAIDAVKELCLHYTPTKSVHHPHMDFVIEELEALPSAQPTQNERVNSNDALDTVSRQAALDAFKVCLTIGRGSGKSIAFIIVNEYADIVRKRIEALPSAQPEQRWIPVSERLPEDLEEVNITWVNHEPESYYADIKDKPYTASAVYYRGKWYWYSAVCVDYLAEYGTNYADEMDEAIEVTAWMPLPEPYEERRADGF